jgi:protein-tyrosine-phosphatase
VCNKAAAESCPVFPGQPAKLHWDIPDPALASGPHMEAAFRETYDVLREKIAAFVERSDRSS